MNRRYLSPLLKKIEQIKADEEYDNQLRIQEIDDLFTFLEKKDTLFDERLQSLEAARQSAEEEAQRTKEAYENALARYELAQTALRGLSSEHMEEIVPEDYEFFISNLNSLTQQNCASMNCTFPESVRRKLQRFSALREIP